MAKIRDKIEKILEKIKPLVKMHGGDVELIEVNEEEVVLKIFGTCVNCPLVDLTYNKIIGELIKKEISKIKKVTIIK